MTGMLATPQEPVFVVGMSRSGTSVTRATLDAHPALSVTPETHFLEVWWSRNRELDLRDPAVAHRFWASLASHDHFSRLGLEPDAVWNRATAGTGPSFRSIFSAIIACYAERAGKSRCGEKTPGHCRYLGTLFEWYTDARVVYLIRDPRAVVASHLVLDAAWANRGLLAVAREWAERARLLRDWSADPRVHALRYESLVADPDGELARLLGFLGLETFPAVPESSGPAGPVMRADGSLSPFGPIAAVNTDAWRDRLSEAQVAVIEHLVRPEMVHHGYAAVTRSLAPRYRVALGRERARFVTQRARRIPRRLALRQSGR